MSWWASVETDTDGTINRGAEVTVNGRTAPVIRWRGLAGLTETLAVHFGVKLAPNWVYRAERSDGELRVPTVPLTREEMRDHA